MLRASVRPSQEGLSYSTYHVFTPGRDSNVAFMYNDSYGAVAIDYATQNPDDEDYIKDGILGGSLEVVQGDAPRSSRKRTIEEVDDAEQDETARALFIEDEHMEEELVDADPEAPGDGDEDMDLNDMDLSQASNAAGVASNPFLGQAEGLIGKLSHGRINRQEYTRQAIAMSLMSADRENGNLYV